MSSIETNPSREFTSVAEYAAKWEGVVVPLTVLPKPLISITADNEPTLQPPVVEAVVTAHESLADTKEVPPPTETDPISDFRSRIYPIPDTRSLDEVLADAPHPFYRDETVGPTVPIPERFFSPDFGIAKDRLGVLEMTKHTFLIFGEAAFVLGGLMEDPVNEAVQLGPHEVWQEPTIGLFCNAEPITDSKTAPYDQDKDLSDLFVDYPDEDFKHDMQQIGDSTDELVLKTKIERLKQLSFLATLDIQEELAREKAYYMPIPASQEPSDEVLAEIIQAFRDIDSTERRQIIADRFHLRMRDKQRKVS